MSIPSLDGIPQIQWLNGTIGNAEIDTDTQKLTMTTGKETDWFNPPPDPSSPTALSNAPALVFKAPNSTDWQLSAKVTVHHEYLFDAGTLFVYQGNNDWCKLCFEYSPEKHSQVVSVVTRDVSDDANGAVIDGNNVYLRISKYGSVIAFHYSVNNGNGNGDNDAYWTLTRAFSMRDMGKEMMVGFLAQAPTGDSCTAVFEDVKFTETTLRNLRDGS